MKPVLDEKLKCPKACLLKISSLLVGRADLQLEMHELVFSKRLILRMLLQVYNCCIREKQSHIVVLAARMLVCLWRMG